MPALPVELHIAGTGEIDQQTAILVTNPLHVTVLPRVARSLPVRIENLSGDAFNGTVSLSGGSGRNASVPLVLKPGDKEATIQLSLPDGTGPRYSTGLTVRDQRGAVALTVPPAEYRQIDDWSRYAAGAVPDDYNLVPEGDAKVASEQTLTFAAPPAGPPMPGMAVFKITYRFDEGWKFLQVMPKTDALKQLDGQPKALGLWVYGDGKGNLARMRFTDATGQTFQPGGEAITWQGWRYIEFPLNANNAGFWGGAKDGVVHYPIHIDTLFLFDSANRKKQAGEVYISGPTLVY